VTLSTKEIAAVRRHLGYGNLTVAALPYTPDGYWEQFNNIVSPYLETGVETTSTTATTAGSVQTITVADGSAFSVYDSIIVDNGEQAEITVLKAVSGNSLTAYFAKAHTAAGYPVATDSGKARLRLLLHEADNAWSSLFDQSVGKTSGIKSVDKDDVVFFDGQSVLKGRLEHYRSIVTAISSLVRVPYLWHFNGRNCGSSVELY